MFDNIGALPKDVEGLNRVVDRSRSGRERSRACSALRPGALGELRYAASVQATLDRQGREILKLSDAMFGQDAGDLLVAEIGSSTIVEVIEVKSFDFSKPVYNTAKGIRQTIKSMTDQITKHEARYPGVPISVGFRDQAPQHFVDACRKAGITVRNH